MYVCEQVPSIHLSSKSFLFPCLVFFFLVVLFCFNFILRQTDVFFFHVLYAFQLFIMVVVLVVVVVAFATWQLLFVCYMLLPVLQNCEWMPSMTSLNCMLLSQFIVRSYVRFVFVFFFCTFFNVSLNIVSRSVC